jgi:hypothetical protein
VGATCCVGRARRVGEAGGTARGVARTAGCTARAGADGVLTAARVCDGAAAGARVVVVCVCTGLGVVRVGAGGDAVFGAARGFGFAAAAGAGLAAGGGGALSGSGTESVVGCVSAGGWVEVVVDGGGDTGSACAVPVQSASPAAATSAASAQTDVGDIWGVHTSSQGDGPVARFRRLWASRSFGAGRRTGKSARSYLVRR